MHKCPHTFGHRLYGTQSLARRGIPSPPDDGSAITILRVLKERFSKALIVARLQNVKSLFTLERLAEITPWPLASYYCVIKDESTSHSDYFCNNDRFDFAFSSRVVSARQDQFLFLLLKVLI